MASALFKLVLLTLLRRSLTSASARVEHFSLLNDPPITRAFAEMASRLAADFSVQTLCRSVGLSRQAFMARFTAAFGESPMSVLRRLRMRLACWLPMHCPSSKLHFTRGIRAAAASLEPSGTTRGPALQTIGQKRNASSVAYQIEEDGAPSDRGHDKNNAQIHATLDEL